MPGGRVTELRCFTSERERPGVGLAAATEDDVRRFVRRARWKPVVRSIVPGPASVFEPGQNISSARTLT